MGEEIANRTLLVPDVDTILTDAVKTWTDMAVTSMADNMPSIPERTLLYQNYPNPFNSSTSIRFVLPSRSYVNLRIYDLLGRQVATVADGELQEGMHARQWQAAEASGVYILRLEAQSLERPHEVYRESRTMTLMR